MLTLIYTRAHVKRFQRGFLGVRRSVSRRSAQGVPAAGILFPLLEFIRYQTIP